MQDPRGESKFKDFIFFNQDGIQTQECVDGV